MNYDVQNALREKADNWRVFNLESDINTLKRELNDTKSDLRRVQNDYYELENKIQRLREAFYNLGETNSDFYYLADILR